MHSLDNASVRHPKLLSIVVSHARLSLVSSYYLTSHSHIKLILNIQLDPYQFPLKFRFPIFSLNWFWRVSEECHRQDNRDRLIRPSGKALTWSLLLKAMMLFTTFASPTQLFSQSFANFHGYLIIQNIFLLPAVHATYATLLFQVSSKTAENQKPESIKFSYQTACYQWCFSGGDYRKTYL